MNFARYASLIVAMLFSIGCLNYTKAFGVEAHVEFAAKTGFPGPSLAVYWIGVLGLAAASMTLGYLLGRKSTVREASIDNAPK